MEYEAQTPASFWQRMHSRYRYHTHSIRYVLYNGRENAWNWLAWHLPRQLIYFAVIRLWAHGTTGKYGMTTPDELTWGEALKRWSKPN